MMRSWAGLASVALACLLAGPSTAATEDDGEALYLRGSAGPGRSLLARQGAGEWRLTGAVVACANCHGVEREGGSEGVVRAPSLRWVDGDAQARAQLRDALTRGIARDGHPLDPAMPRFEIDEADVDGLHRYLAAANGDGRRPVALPVYLTLVPVAARRLSDEATLLDGLQRCVEPMTGSALPAWQWRVLTYDTPTAAVAQWRGAVTDARVAMIVAPSLRGWKDDWLREAQGAGAARWPPILYPLVDDPQELGTDVPVHWLFGGATEREAVLAQARREHRPATGADARWSAVPARLGAAAGSPVLPIGALWAEAACVTLRAVQQKTAASGGAPLAAPAQRAAWALQRSGRIETTQGLVLEPARRIAVKDWAVWETAPGIRPRLVAPWLTTP